MSDRDYVEAPDFARAADALNRAGFDRVAGRAVVSGLRKAANAVRRHVRAEARPHRKTGHLSSGVRTSFRGVGLDFTARITSTGPIAHLIAGGVKPHDVGPPPYRRGNAAVMALHAPGKAGGITGYATVVHNPGFAADPYFARGVDASKADINAAVKAAGEVMVKELAYRMKGK